METLTMTEPAIKPSMNKRIFVKHEEKIVGIDASEILFIKAERNYCTLQTKEFQCVITMPLGNLEEQLNPEKFLRVHRSYLINIDKIESLSMEKDIIYIASFSIPLSRRKKEVILNKINML